MTKRFLSLSVALMMLMMSMIIPFSASAVTSTWTPDFTFTEDFNNITDVADSGLTFSGDGAVSIEEGKLKTVSTTTDGTKTITVKYDLPNAITTGTLEASFRMTTNGISMGAHHFLVQRNGDTERKILEACGNWIFYPGTDETPAGVRTENSKPEPTLHADGTYHLRTVAWRDNVNSNWIVTLYDDANALPNALYTTTISASTHDQLTGLTLLSTYPFAEQIVTIDDFSVKTYSAVPGAASFKQDFEDIEDLAESGLSFTSKGGTAEIITENGNKKLKADFYGSAGSNAIYIDYNMPRTMTKGMIEVSYKINEFDGVTYKGSRNFFKYRNGSNSLCQVLEATDGWYDHPGRVKGSAPTVAADGMYHLRTVLFRESAETDWTLIFYDDGGVAPAIRSVQSVAASSVSGVRILENYPDGGGSTLTFDDIEVNISDELPEAAEVNYEQNFDTITTPAASGLEFPNNGGTAELITVNGNNKLKVNFVGSNGANSIQIDYVLPNVVTKGMIEASCKVDAFNGTDAAASRNFLQYYSGNTGLGTVLEATDGWYDFPGRVKGSAPTVADDGMYHLRTVLYRASEADDWSLTLYDDGGLRPVIRSTQTISAAAITSVRILGIWSYVGGSTLNFDDIKVTVAKEMPVVEPNDDYSQDFEGLAEGLVSAADFQKATGLEAVGHATNGIGEITAVKADGNTKISLHAWGPYATHKPISIDYYTTEPVKKGALSASMQISMDSFTAYCGARHMFNFKSGTQESKSLLNTMDPYWIQGSLGVVPVLNPTVADNGMYHLRAVISRENVTDDWKVVLYNDATEIPGVILSGTVPAENLEEINQIRLVNLYPDQDITMNMDNVAVKYFKFTEDAHKAPVKSEDNIILDEDFTDAKYDSIVGIAQSANAMAALNSKLTFGTEGSTSFTVKEAAAGTRYISVQGSNSNTSHSVAASFADIRTGNIVMEEKILLAKDPFGIDYKIGILNNAMTLGSTEGYRIESMNNGNNIFGYGTGTAGTKKYPFTPDPEGFVSIKWVLSRRTAADSWTLNIYDGYADKLMDTVQISYVDPGDSSGKFIDALRKFTFVNSWGLNSSTTSLDATAFKVWQPKTVSFAPMAGYSNVTKSISFATSEALAGDSVSAETVILTDENDNKIEIEAASYTHGVITVTTKDVIEAGDYTLRFNGVQTARRTYVYDAAEVIVAPASGTEFSGITATAGETSLTVSLNVTNHDFEAEDFEIVFAAYGKDTNKLLGVASSKPQTTKTDGTPTPATATIQGVTLSDDMTFKVFYLDGLSTLAPTRAVEVLSPAQFQ